MTNAQIRQQLRQKRLQLSHHQQQQHALQVANILSASNVYKNSRHVALYLANDGELNPCFILKKAWQENKKTYLPVLWPHQQKGLWFSQYHLKTQLIKNSFGIIEPNIDFHSPTSTKAIDLILMPLVGYDNAGNRIGMGGGYYDRTLAFKRQQHNKPLLIGLAHSCQQHTQIKAKSWDVPLDAIATEQGLVFFNNHHSPLK